MNKKLLAAFVYIGFFLFISFSATAQDNDDYIVHTIKHGEVPSVLAKKYNVPLADLVSLNKWGPNVTLHVGDKIRLPMGAHIVQSVVDSAKVTPPPPPVVKTPLAPVQNAPAVVSVPAEELEGRSAPSQMKISPVLVPATPKVDTSRVITHVITHGEVPSVLSKKYNVPLEELTSLNKWTAKTILHVGDKIKLPPGAHLTAVTDTVKVVSPPVVPKVNPPAVVDKPATDTTINPAAMPIPGANQFTYVVQKKETLYSISKKYNITVARLKNWNRLLEDNITEGQKLIIYTNTPVTATSTVAKSVPTTGGVKENAVQPQPPVVKENAIQVPPPVVKENKPAPKPQTAPATAVVLQAPSAAANVADIPAGGYFTSIFGQDAGSKNLKTSNGMAMTFKTASGWNDKKYYILMNDVAPGSVVKITVADGKYVYAKILWNMGDAKDNEGLDFRISDAAASALGLKDAKFQLTVSYYQ